MSAIPHVHTQTEPTPTTQKPAPQTHLQSPSPTGDGNSPNFSLHPSDFSLPAPRKLADIQSQIQSAGQQLDDLLTQSDLSQEEATELLLSHKYKSHRQLRTALLSQQLQLFAQDHAKMAIQRLTELTHSKHPAIARLACTQLLAYAALTPPDPSPLSLPDFPNDPPQQSPIPQPPSPQSKIKNPLDPPTPYPFPTTPTFSPGARTGEPEIRTRRVSKPTTAPPTSINPRPTLIQTLLKTLLKPFALLTALSLASPPSEPISHSPFRISHFNPPLHEPQISPYNRPMNTNQTPSQQTIPILDFGAQYVQLIARRVREAGVYSLLVRPDISLEELRKLNPIGIILSGGPSSVYEKDAPRCDPKIFDLNVPILGICYGMQIATQLLGGDVQPAHAREYGRTKLRIGGDLALDGSNLKADDLLHGVPQDTTVWMSHGDQVQTLGPEFVALASTPTCPLAAMRHREKPFYGVQFHPEVTHTPHGTQMLENFLYRICKADGSWRMGNFVEREVEKVRAQVGGGQVICGLSGGVDSSVLAALLHKAIGKQLTCIFVDNGLLRKNERDTVEATFRDHFKIDLRVVDAAEKFLGALRGVTEPQEKRKIIGKTFIDVFKLEAAGIKDGGGARFLAQGTLYPDVIESGHALVGKGGLGGGGGTANIKLHHNVGGLPAELGFELVEPLRELFKDEVRKLGLLLELPEHIVWRHPFPGPGLAVRCIGEITAEKLAILRDADEIFLEEIIAEGLYRSTAQTFAAILPIRAVGVMGDGRSYQHVIALRSVDTSDFMTADWSRMPYEVLARVSNRIVNEVRGVSRVVYDITSKPPGTIEWE